MLRKRAMTTILALLHPRQTSEDEAMGPPFHVLTT